MNSSDRVALRSSQGFAEKWGKFLGQIGRAREGYYGQGGKDLVTVAYQAGDFVKESWEKPKQMRGWGVVKLKHGDLVDTNRPTLTENKEELVEEVALRVEGVLSANELARMVGEGVMGEDEQKRYYSDALHAVSEQIVDYIGDPSTENNSVWKGKLVWEALVKNIGEEEAKIALYESWFDKTIKGAFVEHENIVVGEPKHAINFWRSVGEGKTKIVFNDEAYAQGSSDPLKVVIEGGKSVKKLKIVDIRMLQTGMNADARYQAFVKNLNEIGLDFGNDREHINEALKSTVSGRLDKFGIGDSVDQVRQAKWKHLDDLRIASVVGGAAAVFNLMSLAMGKISLGVMQNPQLYSEAIERMGGQHPEIGYGIASILFLIPGFMTLITTPELVADTLRSGEKLERARGN